jgi:hypothetical protein
MLSYGHGGQCVGVEIQIKLPTYIVNLITLAALLRVECKRMRDSCQARGEVACTREVGRSSEKRSLTWNIFTR